MRIFDLISMTMRNLLRRKARTLLTMTGVVVGTCAIVVMISLGLAMTKAMEESLAQMGDLTQITIQNYGSSKDKPKLNDSALKQIQQIENVVAVTPFANVPNMNMSIVSGRNDRYKMQLYNVMGVYPEALSYFGYKTREGELLTASATPKKTANIMFGSESAYEFEDTKRSWRNNRISAVPDEKGNLPDPFVNPMKDKIIMKLESQEQDDKGDPKYPTITRDVHVTGVLESNPSLGWETSYYCFMDIRELQQLYKEYKRVNKIKTDPNNSYSGNDGLENYTQVKVKVSDIDAVSSVDEAIKAMGFETYSLESVREPMQKQMQQQQLFLGSLAAISLLVAAIGITNTMIMSIYERTREIGVMKVLGCKVANIREVFLMEAGLIGFCGGLAGVGVSLAISKLLNYLATNGSLNGENGNFLSGLMGGIGSMAMGSELSIIPGWLMISAIVFATIIGLVSGFYPANRAVKISALEAIKHE